MVFCNISNHLAGAIFCGDRGGLSGSEKKELSGVRLKKAQKTSGEKERPPAKAAGEGGSEGVASSKPKAKGEKSKIDSVLSLVFPIAKDSGQGM